MHYPPRPRPYMHKANLSAAQMDCLVLHELLRYVQAEITVLEAVQQSDTGALYKTKNAREARLIALQEVVSIYSAMVTTVNALNAQTLQAELTEIEAKRSKQV